MIVTLFLRAAWSAVAIVLVLPFVTWTVRSKTNVIRICSIAFAIVLTGSFLSLLLPLAHVSATSVARTCRSAQLRAGQGLGHLDALTADGAPQADLGDRAVLAGERIYHISGWAAAEDRSGPASEVCLIVDGKLTAASGKLGVDRPDVAKYFNNAALEKTGFDFAGPARQLGAGLHTIDVAVVNADGSATHVGTARTIDVRY